MKKGRLSQNEVDVLIDLYEATNGRQWKTQTGWKDPISDEQYQLGTLNWFGTTWDERGHLIAIELENNGLNGSLPESITKLRHLRTLKLRNNPKLKGKVSPQFHKMKRLRYCYLDGTGLYAALDASQGHCHFQITQHKADNKVTTQFVNPKYGTRWQIDMQETEMFFTHAALQRARLPPPKVPTREALQRTHYNATGPERVEAATFLQRVYRGKLARRALRRLLAQVYEKRIDQDTGEEFFFNTRTGEASWDRPRGFQEETSAQSAADQVDERVEDPVNWEEYQDRNGVVYYYNLETGESRYDKPRMRTKFDQEMIDRYGKEMDPEERYKCLFREVDKDDSGFVDLDEFTALCGELGLILPASEIERIMNELDTSGDGLLDQNELVTWLKTHFK